jgi:peptidoglycan/xylan/chitin deacetylase (PgdA/CDA1 family)
MNGFDQKTQHDASSGPILQRNCDCGGSCGDCAKKESLQRSAAGSAHAPEHAPPIVHDVLRSSGQALDRGTRASMESRFGYDFSRVRVHTDANAARSAGAVGAEAYTVGQHIVFGSRGFSPATREGKSLLAHELAHTVQQRSAGGGSGPLPISTPNDAGEREAHHLAESAAASKPAGTPHASAPQLARATRNFLLTFDDGPDGANKLGSGANLTEKVLDTLCERSVKAGFFVQTAAENAAGKPFRGSAPIGQTLIKRMASDGHDVGIHTGGKKDHESHPSAHKAGRLENELTSAKAAIKTLTGTTPTMVRPPFGATKDTTLGVKSADVKAVYSKLALSNTLWDIDADRGKKGKATTLADIEGNITDDLKLVAGRKWKGTTPLDPTIVVLLHDIRTTTAKNVGGIIDHIKKATTAVSGGKDTATFPSIACNKVPEPDKGDFPLEDEFEPKPLQEPSPMEQMERDSTREKMA